VVNAEPALVKDRIRLDSLEHEKITVLAVNVHGVGLVRLNEAALKVV
jgi:hypothetical protein